MSGAQQSLCNQIIGLIRRTITYKEKELIIHVYKAVFRPTLEDCIQACFYRKYVDTFERMRGRVSFNSPRDKEVKRRTP